MLTSEGVNEQSKKTRLHSDVYTTFLLLFEPIMDSWPWKYIYEGLNWGGGGVHMSVVG